VLQPGFVDEVTKSLNLNGDPSVVIRFEFFRYLGRFDDEGLADPRGADTPNGNVLNDTVGAYVGEQIAGFNAVQAAAVPEPETGVMFMAGILAMGAAAVRRRRA